MATITLDDRNVVGAVTVPHAINLLAHQTLSSLPKIPGLLPGAR